MVMEAATEVNGDHFVVEDLLDFSNDDDAMDTDGGFDAVNDLSPVSAVNESSNSTTFSGFEPGFADGTIFAGDLCVPCDDVAELEWLSNFVEESFSSDDQQTLHMLSGFSIRPESRPATRPEPVTPPDADETVNADIEILPVPAKARSKRSRSGVCNWTSNRLIIVDPAGKIPAGENAGGCERRCRHCSTDKTPQWRTGPDGPKTLCNACGVRYKSGRLVPEYRPAASPTFMLTKHSNSHRKVMELRRQKERFVMARDVHDAVFDDLVDGSNGGDGFLIHHHVGPDFTQLL